MLKNTIVIVLAIVTLGYLLPTAIAVIRKHRNAVAICVLNILLGWTLIGWVVSLVWALTDNCYGK